MCIAAGYHAIIQLDITRRSRGFDIYSLVPQSCVAVLESDDVNTLFQEISSVSFENEINRLHISDLLNFILAKISYYDSMNAHGLGSELNHFLLSFHSPDNLEEQVIYFHISKADQDLLTDMLLEYSPNTYLPKEETYRGEKMKIYPLGHTEYLSTYAKDEFMVISFQKRLVEKVIDTYIEGKSLKNDKAFAQILERKKNRHTLSLYSQSVAVPMLRTEDPCWSEYDIHLKSDVVYISGEVYQHDTTSSSWEMLIENLHTQTPINKEQILFSTNRDSTSLFIEQISDKNEPTLFEESIANLSHEAVYTFVADMEQVESTPMKFRPYLPEFILKRASALSPFILSVQYSPNHNRLSHFWLLTYKN